MLTKGWTLLSRPQPCAECHARPFFPSGANGRLKGGIFPARLLSHPLGIYRCQAQSQLAHPQRGTGTRVVNNLCSPAPGHPLLLVLTQTPLTPCLFSMHTPLSQCSPSSLTCSVHTGPSALPFPHYSHSRSCPHTPADSRDTHTYL